MKKIVLLILLGGSVALSAMAGVLPPESLSTAESYSSSQDDNNVKRTVMVGGIDQTVNKETGENDINATVSNTNDDNGTQYVSLNHQLQGNGGRVNPSVEGGKTYEPTGHGGAIRPPKDPRPIKPGRDDVDVDDNDGPLTPKFSPQTAMTGSSGQVTGLAEDIDEKSAPPVVVFRVSDLAVTVTTGTTDDEVMFLDDSGQLLGYPFTVQRGIKDQTMTIHAAAQQDGKQLSDWVTFEVVIPAQNYPEGDVNHDGKVDIEDVTALMNQLTSKAE